MAFQNITIQGNIGKIEPLTFANNGTPVLKLSVAVSEKKPGGEEDTQWFNVKIFKGTAETVDKFFNVGDTILLNGKMNFYKYGEEPNFKYGAEMIAFTFSFCGKSSKQDNQQSAGHQPQQNQGFNQQPQYQQRQENTGYQNSNDHQHPHQGPPDDDIPFACNIA